MTIQHSTKRILVISLLSFIGVAAGLGWLWYITATDVDRLLSEAKLVADNKATAEADTKIKAIAAESEPERAKLKTFLLNRDDTVALLSDIETMAADQYLEFRTDSLSVEEHSGKNDELVVKVHMSGLLQNVKNMIAIMELLPYHSKVTNLNMEYEKDGTASADLTVRITLAAYES